MNDPFRAGYQISSMALLNQTLIDKFFIDDFLLTPPFSPPPSKSILRKKWQNLTKFIKEGKFAEGEGGGSKIVYPEISYKH